jgi:8-oxo-dGTP pyrophosphatase MutT (NUDIX family)
MSGLRQSTLCLLLDPTIPTRLLLGYKKAGFGQGKFTGFGGKLEPGETVEAAAQREMLEESGIRVRPADFRLAGRLHFYFPARPDWSQQVTVYLVTAWQGEPQESDEMRPQWFSLDRIPYPAMWQDSRHWLPPILDGRRIRAEFVFQEDNESIQSVTVTEELYD